MFVIRETEQKKEKKTFSFENLQDLFKRTNEREKEREREKRL